MPRLERPRVPPLPDSEWSDGQREIMKPFVAQGRVFNVFATLLNHPDLFRRWLVFANHVLGKVHAEPARPRDPHSAHGIAGRLRTTSGTSTSASPAKPA